MNSNKVLNLQLSAGEVQLDIKKAKLGKARDTENMPNEV